MRLARSTRSRFTGPRFSAVIGAALLAGSLLTLPASASNQKKVAHASDQIDHLVAPRSRVGTQLAWLLDISTRLPLSKKEESSHFDAAFIKVESAAQLSAALGGLATTGSKVTLLGLSNVTPESLVAEVKIGAITYNVDLSVDAKGLIAGLYFSLNKSVSIPTVSSWTEVDQDIKKMAPNASFLAAQLNTNGTCSAVHEMNANTARPLGSMFKLFILGALAHAIQDHTVSWDQKLTLTESQKVGGSGVLQSDPNGTQLTVEQTALTMISVSDNTAADMLLSLVGRSAVEDQVRAWSSHSSLDTPFLSAAEFFVLKWYDYPRLANHFLSLDPVQRLSYLTSTVDRVRASAIMSTSSPRAIDSVEWFASPLDICHALSGLSSLESQPGLSPLSTILSTNNGGIPLNVATWPRIWFKGGSEPGVLTLGYLARDSAGKSFVVIVMLSNTKKAIAPSSTLLGLGVVAGSFNLLRAGAHTATPGAP